MLIAIILMLIFAGFVCGVLCAPIVNRILDSLDGNQIDH